MSGLRGKVHLVRGAGGLEPNLKIARSWLEQAGDEDRFGFGEPARRECLLMWRRR
ncbi:MAG: hypothetical protein FJY75_01830 [Candidatus Eisenbacteria bacterium]|uniref:Uncharacterized protein n=1 Tax=Eiseniibacteriota bacterium TaxID=2212470 RepID=A0A937X7G7_UNCEI|nr:hypothetical protein [Candidatus Eisenbacteria bacterium]